MSERTIYCTPDTCSIATMCALEQCDLAYDVVPVKITPDGAGDDAFIRLNPRRELPVLVLDDAHHERVAALPARQKALAREGARAPIAR
jgi:glutathione S-transferase